MEDKRTPNGEEQEAIGKEAAVETKAGSAPAEHAPQTNGPSDRSGETSVMRRFKAWYARKFHNEHYISAREVRRIARDNKRTMQTLEKNKRRRVCADFYTAEMRDENNILEIENLNTYFFTDSGVVKAVNGVSFDIPKGSIVGVVGESGCGKSITSMSVMRLVQAPQGQIVEGSIRFRSLDYKRGPHGKEIPVYEYVEPKIDASEEPSAEDFRRVKQEAKKDKHGNPVLDKEGNPVMEPVQARDRYGALMYETEEHVYDIAKMPTSEMCRLRGRQISMIFQEPMTSLNPVFTIGNQLDEVTLLHVPNADRTEAKRRSIEMLDLVGISMPERVYRSYPHELSGGMRQRVMIAMSLACNPRLIIADEPTTALDVTIQAQILDLLREIKTKIDGSIMLITHDLGVIAEMADYVVVMYAGRIVEKGTAEEIFDRPCHPYTVGLQKSKPTMNSDKDRLFNIPGNVPNPIDMPDYCYFKERCGRCVEACKGAYPEMVRLSPTHSVACHLYAEEHDRG